MKTAAELKKISDEKRFLEDEKSVIEDETEAFLRDLLLRAEEAANNGLYSVEASNLSNMVAKNVFLRDIIHEMGFTVIYETTTYLGTPCNKEHKEYISWKETRI